MLIGSKNKCLERRWCTLALLVVCMATLVPAWSSYDSRGEYLDESVTKFTSDMFKAQMNIVQENDNIIMAPFSVQMILSLLAEGAAGRTAMQMKKALNVPENSKTSLDHFNRILEDIKQGNENPRLKFLIANRLYLRSGFHLNPNFSQTLQGFDTGIEKVVFSKRKTATDKINKWISARTKNKISNILTPDDISQATTLILVNALYFDAKWQKSFATENTTMEKFTGLKGETYEVPMMYQKLRTRYAKLDEYGIEILDIPYSNYEYTLTIIMPEDFSNNDYIKNKLEETISVVRTQQPNFVDVSLWLPRFKIEDSTNYGDILRVIMPDAFSQQANFANIAPSRTGGGITISKVVSKSLIEVNEEGTLAAGASAVGAITLSIPQYIPEVDMRVNKPFIFLISSKKNNAPYFIGRYMHP